MKTQLKEFAIKHSWITQMNNSKGLDGHSNYSGGMEKPDWVVVVGQNRDSELLDSSNFDSALEMLGGESKNVAIERFGHWGCGWFELILVNPKSLKHVKIAFDIHESLDRYPVLDESDYFDREREYQNEYAENTKYDLAKALALHFGLPESFNNNKDLIDLAYELNIWVQGYAGNDSCINVYESRAPDANDLERLEIGLKQIGYQYELNPAYQYICACFGLESAK